MAAPVVRSASCQKFPDVRLPDPSYGEFHQPFHDLPEPRADPYIFAVQRAHQHGQHVENVRYRGVMLSGYVMS